MTKEETKQWLRTKIDSCIEIKSTKNNGWVDLIYNKSYIRALKLSKITGQSVNKENFKGGVLLFDINTKTKEFWYYDIIADYLIENYSTDYTVQKKIIQEVLNEYEEYQGYNWGW